MTSVWVLSRFAVALVVMTLYLVVISMTSIITPGRLCQNPTRPDKAVANLCKPGGP